MENFKIFLDFFKFSEISVKNVWYFFKTFSRNIMNLFIFLQFYWFLENSRIIKQIPKCTRKYLQISKNLKNSNEILKVTTFFIKFCKIWKITIKNFSFFLHSDLNNIRRHLLKFIIYIIYIFYIYIIFTI